MVRIGIGFRLHEYSDARILYVADGECPQFVGQRDHVLIKPY
jgi:hypothetical protein